MAQTASVPEMDLEVNRMANATIARGWPVIIRTVMISSDGGPVGIGVNGGPWTQALTLTVADQNGVVQKWPVQLLPADSDSLALGAVDTGQAIWVIAPEATQSVPDGTYTIRATLDTTRSAAPGQVAVQAASRPVELVVGQEPDMPSPDDDALKYSSLADYALLTGHPDDASAALDTLIERQPDNMMAQFEKAELLEDAGDFETALDMMQAVLTTTQAKEVPGDPPHTVLQQFVLRLAEELGNQQNATAQKAKKQR
jgi:hypothetical protein